MQPKTITGPFGIAREYDTDFMFKQIGQRDATLAMFAIKVPWANMLWQWYFVHIAHLRGVQGFPKPIFTLPGATHEVVIYALNPEYDFNARRNPGESLLHPVNFVGQIIRATDAEAVAEVVRAVQDCVDGNLSPDTDYTQHWIARFGSSNIKGDPKTAGETIIQIGNHRLQFDPAPLTKKPKDTLCKFCGSPVVAEAVVGDKVCNPCSKRPDHDASKSILLKMIREVTKQ